MQWQLGHPHHLDLAKSNLRRQKIIMRRGWQACGRAAFSPCHLHCHLIHLFLLTIAVLAVGE